MIKKHLFYITCIFMGDKYAAKLLLLRNSKKKKTYFILHV